MICEICGKESEFTKAIFIEGTQLKVCKECSRFGESSDGKGGGAKKKSDGRRSHPDHGGRAPAGPGAEDEDPLHIL